MLRHYIEAVILSIMVAMVIMFYVIVLLVFLQGEVTVIEKNKAIITLELFLATLGLIYSLLLFKNYNPKHGNSYIMHTA